MFSFDCLRPFSNLAQLLSTHPSDTVRRLPPTPATTIVALPGKAQLVFVRDADSMRTLARDRALDRGPGVNLLKSVFGPDTLFLMPHGKLHERRAGEFNRHFGQRHIEALTPEIAAHANRAAATTRAALSAAPDAPVDMRDIILRYLFDVGARAIAGVDVDLCDQVDVFRRGVEALHREATSMLKTALAANLPGTAPYMAKEARRAADEFHEAGRRMLVAGADRHDIGDSLALSILKRHKIDPAQVNEATRLPKPVLVDAAMSLAASLFTTGNQIERTLHHFYEHPKELQQLRRLIREDFPDGVGEVTQLRNCPTLRQLLPATLTESPVGIVSRDVLDATSFTDGNGTSHPLRKGDAVIFDIEDMQARHVPDIDLALAEDGRPTLELFNQRHDDIVQTFFSGPNRCPGRYLAVADSQLFLIEMLSKFDDQSIDRNRPLERGIVNRLGGSPLMRLTPVRTERAISPP